MRFDYLLLIIGMAHKREKTTLIMCGCLCKYPPILDKYFIAIISIFLCRVLRLAGIYYISTSPSNTLTAVPVICTASSV